ncbi:MAG: VWA domain-containing protein [Holophagales bacterium]|nr:VWA domain-containing protein [Holophagales bacterium]MYG31821.1 VWA domain-containing protein [Holophagales bacterium]MYI79663.1 VWA domain-containing protein [Holophagales bacterium]
MIGATLLGAVLALGTPPAPATVAEAGQEAPLGRGVGELSDVVEVTVVNVDVVATDRNGRPADELSRQNFRVFDNGAPVELSYFSRGGGAGDADPDLLHEPLSIAFFFDNTHLSVASRSAVMDQIKDFARGQLEAGDRSVPVYAMVVAFDGELRLLQDLTTDYIALAQGLNRAEAAHQVFTEAQGLKRRSQESFLQLMEQLNARRQQSAGSIGALRATLSELLAYARVVHQDSARTADAIEDVVESLALVPGRKAFFLISDGFAARPFDRLLQNVQKRVAGRREETGIELMQNREVDAPEGFDAPNNLYTRNSNIQGTAALTATSFQQHLSAFDLSDRYDGLAALANSHRVSFYSFKPPEVEVAAAALSERVSDQQKLTYLSDLRGVLNGLAHDTGGRAWVSGRNVAAFFDQVAADLRSYYSLGYILDEFVEGSIHEVRIRTRPRNLRLRHRTSYVARSLRERLAERTVGALLLGWTENPHGLHIDSIQWDTGGGGFYDVDFTVSVPLDQLVMIEQAGQRTDQVRVVAVVLTEDGEQLAPSHIVLPLAIPDRDWAEAQDQFFAVSFEYPIPRGSHRVAIGLWDENGGNGSYIRREFSVR